MASFDKYSNYDEITSHSEVIFGAEKPVLEVELNELQQILNTKLNRLIKTVLGTSSFIPLTSTSIMYSITGKVLTFNDCIAVASNGWTAYVSGARLELSTTSYSYIYIEMQEVEKDYSATMYAYGNTLGKSVTNTMKDSRSPVETTKRKVITFTIKAGDSLPADTDTVKYIHIGSWNGTTTTFSRNVSNRIEKLEKQLSGLALGVEEGLLYVEVPDEEEE